MEGSSLIALGGFALAFFALIGGVLYRQGKLEGKLDLLIEDNREWREEYRREIRETREEFRREMNETREESRREMNETREEFRREMNETREEFRREMNETREENRRNHQQLLQALAHHSHDQDTGFAIFRIPPGSENPAS